MRKFLLKILWFVIPLIIIAVWFERSIFDIPNSRQFKKELCIQKGESMKQIIIGSSVVAYGVDPAYLPEGTYNMALSGQCMRYDLLFLEKYLSQMPNVKTIIWGWCYQSLWSDWYTNNLANVNGTRNDGLLAEYHLYMDISSGYNPLYYSNITSIYISHLIEKWKKYYIKKESTIYFDSLGLDRIYEHYYYEPNGKEKRESDFARVADIVENHTPKYLEAMQEVYKVNMSFANRVAELCYDKRIELIIILPPVYSSYAELVNSEQLNLIYQSIQEIQQHWPDVKFHDYFKDSRFGKDDFCDPNHLFPHTGAIKFAKILQQDLFDLK